MRWYWLKGSHVTGATKSQQWLVVKVGVAEGVMVCGSDLVYRKKDFKGVWIKIERPA